ncbi:MAG TPA: hypothetical protein GXZ43_03715 [Clostridiaceae bacterium]|nr:hypothetical protein [Clostridiaceae bacterium]
MAILTSDGAVSDVVAVLSGSCADEDGGVVVVITDFAEISLASDEGFSDCFVQPESTGIFTTNIADKTSKSDLLTLRFSVLINTVQQTQIKNIIDVIQSCILF